MVKPRQITPSEFRQRAWDTLMNNRATIKEIIDDGIDLTNPYHLVVARGCALWVQICYVQKKEAAEAKAARNTTSTG